MECLGVQPPHALKKHRTRQKASRAAFMIFSLFHFAIGCWLALEKCPFGWHILGFTLFGVLLLRERSISSNLKIMWGHQCLLMIMTVHALWHYNEAYNPDPVSIEWNRGVPHATKRQQPNARHRHQLHRPRAPYSATTATSAGVAELSERGRGLTGSAPAARDDAEKGAEEEAEQDARQTGRARRPETATAIDRAAAAATGPAKLVLSRPPPNENAPAVSSGGGGSSLLFGLGRLLFGGEPVPLGFTADLENLTPAQVRSSHRQLFSEMPAEGFDRRFKNPCWSPDAPRVGLGLGGSTFGVGGDKYNGGGAHGGAGDGGGVQRRRLLFQDYENISSSSSSSSNGGGGGGGAAVAASPGVLAKQEQGQGKPLGHRHSRALLSSSSIRGGGGGEAKQRMRQRRGVPSRGGGQEQGGPSELECLPYAYLLGMPKCGSSDLWERLRQHPQVQSADRKEVRFFTRGEFSSAAPPHGRGFMPPEERLAAFTTHHNRAAKSIFDELSGTDASSTNGSTDPSSSPRSRSIIVDGGPHTLWWSIQDPNGSKPPKVKVVAGTGTGLEVVGREEEVEEVSPAPIALLLAQLQPGAKLVVTLAEPVRRMYSDYFFLNKDRVATGREGKTPQQFHEVAIKQVQDMHQCFQERSSLIGDAQPRLDPLQGDYGPGGRLSVRAEQACAYDRFHFGQPGSGRIAIGLYHAFLHRWLQVYPRSQLLVVRLEDFNSPMAGGPTAGPRAHLQGIFRWLGLDQPSEQEWSDILVDRTFNEHRQPRDPILSETERTLQQFYAPFNARLARLLGPEGAKGLHEQYEASFAERKHKRRSGGGEAEAEEGEEEEWGSAEEERVDEEERAAKERADEAWWAVGFDEGAARFTWEDVWRLHSQDKPALKSLWNTEEGEEGAGRGAGHRLLGQEEDFLERLPAHELHHPQWKGGDLLLPSAPLTQAVQTDPPPPPPLLSAAVGNLRGGEGAVGEVGSNSQPPQPQPPQQRRGSGQTGGQKSLPEGGRDGLPNLPLDMVLRAHGATSLCLAAMGLHLEAADAFLATEGVNASLAVLDNDGLRTPLHCLGSVWIYGDSLRDSYIFSLLQNKEHWLDQVVVSPPVVRHQSSYGMRHVTHGARHVIGAMALKLLKAGADPNATDADGRSPLHYACLGGLGTLADALIGAGADPNAVEKVHGQTPMHNCASFGHAELLKTILGGRVIANPDLADNFGNTARDIATAVGSAIRPEDLKRHLGWEKVPQRVLPLSSALAMTRKHGHGGWDTDSLLPPLAFPLEDAALLAWAEAASAPSPPPSSPGTGGGGGVGSNASDLGVNATAATATTVADSNSSSSSGGEQQTLLSPSSTPQHHCDLDMLDASELLGNGNSNGNSTHGLGLTPQGVFAKYVMMNRPVLIRGVNQDSPAWQAYARENLKQEHGSKKVAVSDIPYNTKFGSPNGKSETLEQYVDEMTAHSLAGENHPWYVFRGHPVPMKSDSPDSLVNLRTIPVAKLMFDIFNVPAYKDATEGGGDGEGGPPPPPPKRDPRKSSGASSLGLFGGLFGGARRDSGEANATGSSQEADAAAAFKEEENKEEGEEDSAEAEAEAKAEAEAEAAAEYRAPFVNMQWALGTKGSGAPVHFHNTAWSQLFYGRKHWYLFPPGRNLMGKKQVLDWVENDLEGLKTGRHGDETAQEEGQEEGLGKFVPYECIQQQGDVLVVPELWGHAVLNTQDSVTVASEVKGSQFRLKVPRAYKDLSKGMGLQRDKAADAAARSKRRAEENDNNKDRGKSPVASVGEKAEDEKRRGGGEEAAVGKEKRQQGDRGLISSPALSSEAAAAEAENFLLQPEHVEGKGKDRGSRRDEGNGAMGSFGGSGGGEKGGGGVGDGDRRLSHRGRIRKVENPVVGTTELEENLQRRREEREQGPPPPPARLPRPHHLSIAERHDARNRLEMEGRKENV